MSTEQIAELLYQALEAAPWAGVTPEDALPCRPQARDAGTRAFSPKAKRPTSGNPLSETGTASCTVPPCDGWLA
jgi:hypothetical protein